MSEKFYTQRAYNEMASKTNLSASVEDYMEMIYRICLDKDFVRVNVLASELHVKPSSVTKMLAKLVAQGLIDYEKYGIVRVTESGERMGKFLLWRHEVLSKFFSLILEDETEAFVETERAEHILTLKTVEAIEIISKQMGQEIKKCVKNAEKNAQSD